MLFPPDGSQSANKELAVEIVQLYYGLLLLFVVRLTLKAIFSYSRHGFQPSTRQYSQDHDFEQGWASVVYQPMSYALGASDMSFDIYLRALKGEPALHDFPHLQRHCEAAASLLPAPRHGSILEHVQYFFALFYPTPEIDADIEISRKSVLASAQLAELPMA